MRRLARWTRRVNASIPRQILKSVRQSIQRGRPLG
ncbi:hypothetical protein LCGC14_2929830, partial [marine sediment metagenome]